MSSVEQLRLVAYHDYLLMPDREDSDEEVESSDIRSYTNMDQSFSINEVLAEYNKHLQNNDLDQALKSLIKIPPYFEDVKTNHLLNLFTLCINTGDLDQAIICISHLHSCEISLRDESILRLFDIYVDQGELDLAFGLLNYFPLSLVDRRDRLLLELNQKCLLKNNFETADKIVKALTDILGTISIN